MRRVALGAALAVAAACSDITLPPDHTPAYSYTLPATGDVFHWPLNRLPVRFYADPRGGMRNYVQRAVGLWERQFLYGEFRGVVVDERVYDFSRKTDLGRRDFTVNAIAMDLATGELSDPYEGQEDIRRRVIRMISARNFDDDPLRMLRGVRLAVTGPKISDFLSSRMSSLRVCGWLMRGSTSLAPGSSRRAI